MTESGTVSTHGNGRPSYVVQPRDDVTVIGVNLGVDRNTVASVGLGGEVLSRRERPHHRGEHDMLSVVESLAQMIEDALREDADRRCLGIGVAVPGAVGLRDGVVRFAPNLGWVDAPFSAALSSRLGMPVVCDNDAHLGARAEHLRGVAVGRDDIAYLAGSVGVGGGFIVGGQPLTGAQRLRRGDRPPVGGPRRAARAAAGTRGAGRPRSARTGCSPWRVGCPEVGRRPSRRSSGPPQAGRQRASRGARRHRRAGSRSACGRSSTSSTREMVVLGDSLALIWQARGREISARLGELPLDLAERPASSSSPPGSGTTRPSWVRPSWPSPGLLADPASIAP